MAFIEQCYGSGWLTTVGENIDVLEKMVGGYMSRGEREKRAVALASGTAAIHLAVKLAAERVYHSSSGITTPNGKGSGGSLYGKRVFVSDMTFAASVNPIVYEGGEPVFIDSEYETWNMDPKALKRAFCASLRCSGEDQGSKEDLQGTWGGACGGRGRIFGSPSHAVRWLTNPHRIGRRLRDHQF